MRLLLLLALFLVAPGSFAQLKPQATASNPTNDRAIVTPRKVVVVRRGALIKDFPEKKTATVTYPVISGLNDRKVLGRVQSILQIKNVFDTSLAEYRQDRWLDEFGYKVNYNRNSILDITFTQSGSGAYPDTHTKHFAVNLKNGSVVKASDVFLADKLTALSATVNRKLQSELRKILAELAASKSDPEDIRISREAGEVQEFKIENLDDFSVGGRGITFLYDAGYPHVIQPLSPKADTSSATQS